MWQESISCSVLTGTLEESELWPRDRGRGPMGLGHLIVRGGRVEALFLVYLPNIIMFAEPNKIINLLIKAYIFYLTCSVHQEISCQKVAFI